MRDRPTQKEQIEDQISGRVRPLMGDDHINMVTENGPQAMFGLYKHPPVPGKVRDQEHLPHMVPVLQSQTPKKQDGSDGALVQPVRVLGRQQRQLECISRSIIVVEDAHPERLLRGRVPERRNPFRIEHGEQGQR